MKLVVYGLPCSGKTTLISSIANARILNGSSILNQLAAGKFAELSDKEKFNIRIKYTEYVNALDDEMVVSDGHYSFLDDIVFTKEDGDLYDVFFYLYCDPEIIVERINKSVKNSKYSDLSADVIKRWQKFEIDSLRDECHKRNKDFYVISDNNTASCFSDFLSEIKTGLSAVTTAKAIVSSIVDRYPNPCTIYLVDGDKTLIEQDSFRFCCNGRTTVFDGNHYTDYQSYLFKKETENLKDSFQDIEKICINKDVWDLIDGKEYFVLSSGIADLWDEIGRLLNITNIIADISVSADTKYYVAKILKTMGYKVIAIGDSKIDLYMLREADKGYLYIGKRISRSLKEESIDGINLIYDKSSLLLLSENPNLIKDVNICKSNSRINGNLLASAHFRLGLKIGERLSDFFPSQNTALMVLERGGRFFGDGIYCSFGGVFYSYNPSKEQLPILSQERIIIVDSVINTGKSIKRIISEIESNNSGAEIIIVSNVIQENAIKLFSSHKVIGVRSSVNSFVGKNQPKQIGKTGPDTADRLFNLIGGCSF